MPLLDDLSGFEFEDLMEDVFRNLGYENVRQSSRTGDEGRDIIMEEVVDGQRRTVVVECKHTEKVSRPVVQKVHSAAATYDADTPTRAMVVTTGRFTSPAEEYAEKLATNDDPYQVELVDGTRLRTIGEEVGLDLYNGRIEVLCEETLRPTDPTAPDDDPVRERVRGIENLDVTAAPSPTVRVAFEPTLTIGAEIDATFETGAGVIHSIDTSETLTIHAGRGQPRPIEDDIARLVTDNRHARTALDEADFEEQFESVDIERYGRTETEYKEWAVQRLRDEYTTTVQYTGQ